MEKRVKIREITLEDVQAIQKIHGAISQEKEQVDFLRLVEQHASGGTGHTSLVALLDDQVAGYMISTTLYAGFGIEKSAWIMAIGVHPTHMGQGLGLELARQTCEIYKKKGVKSIYSSVMWDSIDVLSFFKKLGFTRSEFINLKKDL